MSLVLTVIMVLSLAGCGKSTELSSVSRDPATDDGTVWFDEEAVAQMCIRDRLVTASEFGYDRRCHP